MDGPSATNYAPEFFIHKYLCRRPQDGAPLDANKLRISEACFETLATQLMIPPAFVYALSRHFLPNGRGSRKVQINNATAFDFWYFLPIRVQVPTGGPQPGIPGDSTGPSQMNPFNKLSLPDVRNPGVGNEPLDIRRSSIGIFSRIEPVSRRVTFVAFDFMHGGWPKVALEPCQRIEEVMKHRKSVGVEIGYGYFIHLVYLSSAARWWTNTINSVHEQLIAYELKLQTDLDNSKAAALAATQMQINRALHSIAAHLHRYLSELKSLQGVIVDLATHYESVHESDEASHLESFDTAARGFSQILSQVEASHDFAQELEKKIRNILALTDAQLGQKMAKASHALAEEMKQDSIAMRTIAVVTMFFLPAATFAALLSMPFFSNNDWFSEASRIWLWIVLTVPATLACFMFYKIWGSRVPSCIDDGNEDIEMQTND
ncbi:hypothetical protein SCUP515_12830 [Seiridium cupressi]